MPNESPQSFSHIRAGIIFTILGAILVVLIGRVAWLQTYGRQTTILKAERQHHQSEELPARRGSIFDRNGALMACTIQNSGVFVDPWFMHDRYQDENRWAQMEPDIAKLAEHLDLEPEKLAALISDNSEQRFLKISERVDERTAEEIKKMKMPGVGLMPVNERVYPMGPLAAHIIGGVGTDELGLEGIEMKYQKLLMGKNGYQRLLKDAKRHAIGVAEDDYVPPEHGAHLVLTIDANIQMFAEQELAACCQKYKAKRGEVVVLDPRTGEVLALANYPTFSPQTISESRPEVRTNNTLVAPYEPGSAIKPFIVGPAFDRGLVTPVTMWPIGGISWSTPYGRHITDVHGYGPLAMWDVLVKSSNIGMCMLAEKLDNPQIHAGLTSFGFGKVTGIELPGEDPGMLNPLVRWSKHSTDSVAQGYELMVTPLQLGRAFCAYANGGRLPQVRIVRGTLTPDGAVVTTRPPPEFSQLPQVLDMKSAQQIRRILADVPLRGTATAISRKVPGTQSYEVPNWYAWNIFGKTGTSHISEGRSGYSGTRFNSTFLGGAPYENPRLVIAMTVHEPDRSLGHYGGTVSAPPSARILVRSLAYLQVSPSPELPPPAPDIAAKLVHFEPSIYHKPTTRPTNLAAR